MAGFGFGVATLFAILCHLARRKVETTTGAPQAVAEASGLPSRARSTSAARERLKGSDAESAL